MELFHRWLLGIVACTILVGAAEELGKGSAVWEVLRFSGALVLLLCILQPIARWDGDVQLQSLSALQRETLELREVYESQHKENVEKSIAERTGAYIEAQAQKMGVPLRAEVEVGETKEGVVPYSVHLDVSCHEPLMQWIAQTLAIPPQRQHWREKG